MRSKRNNNNNNNTLFYILFTQGLFSIAIIVNKQEKRKSSSANIGIGENNINNSNHNNIQSALKTVDFCFKASFGDSIGESDCSDNDNKRLSTFQNSEIFACKNGCVKFKEFGGELSRIIEGHNYKYTKERNDTSRIQEGLEEARSCVALNIKDALSRGETLATLQEQSSVIEKIADEFQNNAVRIEVATWWEKNKMGILILILIMLAIGALVGVTIKKKL